MTKTNLPLLQKFKRSWIKMIDAAQRLVTCCGSIDDTAKRVVPVSPMEKFPMKKLAWRRGGIHPEDRIRLYMNPQIESDGNDYASMKDAEDVPPPTTLYKALLSTIKQYDTKCKTRAGKNLLSDYIATRRDIKVDLERTFPGEKCWINTKKGQASLKRVLLAYSVLHECKGYVQSMSHIAGRLLCIAREGKKMKSLKIEACVFDLLRKICDRFCPTTYCDGMEGLHQSGAILEELIRDRLPALSTHLEARGSSHLGLILATNWFLPLFCADFFKETTSRILDIIMTEGPDTMYAIAIAILRMNQAYLMNSDLDFYEIFGYLKKFTTRMTNVDLLLANAKREWGFLRLNVFSEKPRMKFL
ncbi:hypothetical protein ABG067_000075 [Albugo candida]